jgi:hypothetical protein
LALGSGSVDNGVNGGTADGVSGSTSGNGNAGNGGIAIRAGSVADGTSCNGKLDVERTYHSSFDGFGGSLLCSYSVEEIELRKRGKWIAELLQNHHAAIFIPKSGDGITFIFSCS